MLPHFIGGMGQVEVNQVGLILVKGGRRDYLLDYCSKSSLPRFSSADAS